MSITGDEAAMDLEAALLELERLQSANAELRTDLEECKDQLFDLLQKSNDVPEQAIKDAFGRIINSIESWVDDISGEERFQDEFRNQYQVNLQSSSRKDLFKKLGLGKQYSDITWQITLGRQGTCHNIILSLLIARWLVDDVFLRLGQTGDSLYPFGLVTSEVDFIQTVERAMDSTAENGNVSRSGKWRGETLSALASTENFQNIQDSEIRHAADDLKRQLSQWISSKSLISEHLPALHKKVIEPSVKLAKMAACSSKTYMVRFPSIMPGPFSTGFENWSFKDLHSWRTTNPNDLLGSITCLYPGIVRKGGNDEEDLVLAKPVALGYRDPELQPKASRSNSPQPSRRDHSRPERDTPYAGRLGHGRWDRDSPRPDLPRSGRSGRKQSPTKQSARPPSDPKPTVPKSRGTMFLRGLGDIIGVKPNPEVITQTQQAPGQSGHRPRRPSGKMAPHQAQRHEYPESLSPGMPTLAGHYSQPTVMRDGDGIAPAASGINVEPSQASQDQGHGFYAEPEEYHYEKLDLD